MYQLFIQDKAVVELQDAFDWYEYKRKGLGDAFPNLGGNWLKQD